MIIQDRLKDKRILFLSVQTFSYEKEIANQLRSFGATVDYFDERPTNSIFSKGIIRLKRDLYQVKINKYYSKLLNNSKSILYDYLLLIKGEVIPPFFIEKFKKTHPQCILIYYAWDSFNNNPHAISILKYFDRCFTFDPIDAKKHNISFRHLFYINKYAQLYNRTSTEKKNDLLFIGTAHSDRYKISQSIVNWCSSNNFTCYTYYYMQSKIVYWFKMLFDASFNKFDYKKLHFKSLSSDEIIELYKKSGAILDINHPNQNGLTMRTFEALGAGRKIITTNESIIKYPFYSAHNICVIDRDSPSIDKNFLLTPFHSIDPHIRDTMSLSCWIEDLFSFSDLSK